jgi:hypothetical protein
MLQHRTIRSFLASFLLVVFAFSITPQKNIHDFVAKHVDPVSCKVHKNSPIEQVEHANFHCSYDQLIATSPFVEYNFEIIVTTPEKVIVKNDASTPSFASVTLAHFDSRGPPII